MSAFIIFAGAQELSAFAEDSTSPIASRAARFLMPNLPSESVGEIVQRFGDDLMRQNIGMVTDELYRASGGYAGLTRSLASLLSTPESEGFSTDIGERLRQGRAEALHRHEALFRIWDDSLSNEGRTIRDALSVRRRIDLKELPALLSAQSLNALHAIRSADELVFTGVALRSSGSVSTTNELYWLREEAHQRGSSWTDKTGAIWSKIEATEMRLRDFVLRRYETEWTTQTNDVIRAAVGEESWEQIQRNYEAASRKYPLSDKTVGPRIVDLMYIGQFLTLIVFRRAWHLFERDFKDKQSLANIFAAITTVRNDKAHFNPVPEKELLRCYVACDDLSVLIDRAEKRNG